MKPQWLSIVVAAGLAISGAAALAQDYPTRPIRTIHTGAPGATNDVVARLVTHRMAAEIGQQFIVEARPQGAGIPAAQAVTVAAPDGYTLMFTNTGTHSISPAIYGAKLPYDIFRDFEPISVLATVPFVLVVNKDVPANTVQELIALLKREPGKYLFASSGKGTPGHLAAELFKLRAGVDGVHVPYRGAGPAIVDLLGGRVHILFDNPPSVLAHIKSGAVRALATTAAQRLEMLPELPTLVEIGLAGADLASWYGFAAPKGTPRAVIDRVNAATLKAVQDAEVAVKLKELGAVLWGSSPAEMTQFMTTQLPKWQAVVQAAGVTPE